jgi:hypothetical protein
MAGVAVYSGRRAKLAGDKLAAVQAEAESLRQRLGRAASKAASESSENIDLLKLRILELQEQLAEKDRLLAALPQETTVSNAPLVAMEVATNEIAEAHPPWRDRRAWLEEIKEKDPERYHEIMAHREEARKAMHQSFATKAEHYLNRDTSMMSDDELTEYNRMLVLLDETWRMAEQLQSDLPREERRPIMREMRENMEELTPLLDNERDREFYEIGMDFGFTEDEAVEFVDYLNGVVEVTSMRSFFESIRPRFHRPPPGE